MKILITDIETTGFSKRSNSIIEVGLVELDLSNGNRKILFDEVVREQKTTVEEVAESWLVQNGFMMVDEVVVAHFLDHYKKEIQTIINSYPNGCTAFNNIFDFGFLESRGFYFPKKLGCPMRLSKGVCQIQGKRGIKMPSFQEAHDYFFNEAGYIESHRGADDAMEEARLVYELYKLKVFTL